MREDKYERRQIREKTNTRDEKTREDKNERRQKREKTNTREDKNER